MESTTNVRPPAIQFRNVSLYFEDKAALSDVSFSLSDGETLILTGASGCGKSVLLRLAIGLLHPDAGEILIKGRDITALDESELLAIRGGLMGIVFQEDSLFTGLSVFENVAYRLVEHGWSDKEVELAVKEALQFVGLSGEEEKFPEQLSGGMKRRVEIARALVGWPSIMLFDEPTMSLDPIVAVQVLDLVMRARDINETSSIYVTKKMHEIMYLSNYKAVSANNDEIIVSKRKQSSRVMVLDAGRVIFDGQVEQFLESDLPAIKKLLSLDEPHHSEWLHVQNPWDTKRHPHERLL